MYIYIYTHTCYIYSYAYYILLYSIIFYYILLYYIILYYIILYYIIYTHIYIYILSLYLKTTILSPCPGGSSVELLGQLPSCTASPCTEGLPLPSDRATNNCSELFFQDGGWGVGYGLGMGMGWGWVNVKRCKEIIILFCFVLGFVNKRSYL